MNQLLAETSESVPMPRVRRVGIERPWIWLRRGGADLLRTPAQSLGTGALVAAIGLALGGAGWQAAYMAPALLGGFLLVAPFLAIVLYALSRQLEQQGGAVDSAQAWRAWRGNAGSIALFGLMLALAYIVWERLAAIVFALFYEGQALQLSRWPLELMSGQYTTLLLAFVCVGAALAALVFALGVVSAPLLIDRPVDAITAMLSSLQCCRINGAAMLLWAALIAGLTALGFATLMLGLVVIFPLLAHASWHAYRDMVEPG
jgi:uncharacterized membrane protein